MMSGEHSEDIGYLKAKAESTSNQISTLFEHSSDTREMMTEIHTLLTTHVERSEQRYDTLEEDFKDLEEVVNYCRDGVDDHYTIKKFTAWLAAGLALIWSAVWKGIDKIFFS